MATHIIRLVKSKSALEMDFDLVVMKMTADANHLADRYEGAFITTTSNQDVKEIRLTEGDRGPSLQEYKLHMEPSFEKHCSRSFPEIDLKALEIFTK